MINICKHCNGDGFIIITTKNQNAYYKKCTCCQGEGFIETNGHKLDIKQK